MKHRDERSLFWAYCIRAIGAARDRARRRNLPFAINADFLDRLLVDQNWRCAVCGLPLDPPGSAGRRNARNPFGPSLDRIIPELGYVPGNVRIVNNVVNSAMMEWGWGQLVTVANAIVRRQEHAANKTLKKTGTRLRKKANLVNDFNRT